MRKLGFFQEKPFLLATAEFENPEKAG